MDPLEPVAPLEPMDLAELTDLALAADPDVEVDGDQPDLWTLTGERVEGLLPDWYMPTAPAGSRRLTGWRRNTAFVVVGAFFAIDAVGLCTTYGPLIWS